MGNGQPARGELAIDVSETDSGHGAATHVALAKHLATLLDLEFVGDSAPQRARRYFVPKQTLVGRKMLDRHGIHGPDDLFGGWVPHDWMATKAVAHPLIGPGAARLPGWVDDLALHSGDLTLRGYTAFSREDAEKAGRKLLERGPVRLKPIHADGARGQSVVHDADELDEALARLSQDKNLSDAVTMEENLDDVETYSVGMVRAGEHRISYCGTQSLTTDNFGDSVYGGSELLVVNGSIETLLRHDLRQPLREVIACGREFDRLADKYLPVFIASRRNYDIAVGRDADGRRRVAVLEQSWRIGGASAAEILALEVFKAEPDLGILRSRTIERYGGTETPPAGAMVYFEGDDPVVGSLLKYATVDRDIDGRAQDRD